MDPRCRIEMLGPLRVIQSHQTVTRFGTQKAGSLLAFLAHRLWPQPREQVIDLFWPDMDLPDGRNNLSTTLSSLRRQLEPPGIARGAVLITTHACVGLHPATVTTDVAEFERLLQEAEDAGDPKKRASVLGRALALYGGDFQPGNYQDWAVRESERLQSRRVGTLDRLGEDLEVLGRFEEAATVTGQRLSADPYAEAGWVDLVRRHVLAGQSAAACEAVHRCERFFEEEFGAGPSAAVSRAAEGFPDGTIRRLETSPARSAAVPEPPEDKREERAEDERAGEETAPAGSRTAADALPFWLSRFFGRETELAQLADMLLPSKEPLTSLESSERPCRLVTLTGPGGAGKTRLAAEFARLTAERFGAWCGFVALADLRASEQIPSQVAQALHLPSSPAVAPLDQVIAFFRERDRLGTASSLLILDNLEHLLAVEEDSSPEARGGTTGFVGALLKNTAGLSVLCTSRRRLALQGERLLPLGPLAVPDALPYALDEMARCPSVRLYLDRAQAVRPDFGLTPTNAPAVASLCRDLEGSPLALELAASWVRLLPPRAMSERLMRETALNGPAARDRDLPTRQRSLRATLDWSWRLLSPEAGRLLARLSVFRGGWSLEAAEEVCDVADALSLLACLEDSSLIHASETKSGTTRWSVLVTVRDYARERLEEQGEAVGLGRRHAAYFQGQVGQAALTGSDQALWYDLLEADHDNIRAALDQLLQDAEGIEGCLEMAGRMHQFWQVRGYFREGRERIAAALARPGAEAVTAGRAKALHGAANIASRQGDLAAASVLHSESLAVRRALGDEPGIARSLVGLGTVALTQGDLEGAQRFHQEALELYRRLEDQSGLGDVLNNLGNISEQSGNLVEARAFYDQSLAVRRGANDWQSVANTLSNLGPLLEYLEDHRGAARTLRECLSLCLKLGDKRDGIYALKGAARIALAQGNDGSAARLLGAEAALRTALGAPRVAFRAERHQEEIEALRQRMGHSAFDEAWNEGSAMTWEQAAENALACSDCSS